MLDQEENEMNELESLLFMQNDDVESDNDNEGIDDIIEEGDNGTIDDIEQISQIG
jgi:predicted nucleotidyltransferase